MLQEVKGPSVIANNLIIVLKTAAFVQLFFGTCKLFLNFFAGMTDIISSLIIFISAYKLNFVLSALYPIGNIANLIVMMAQIGVFIQKNNQSLFSGDPTRNVFYIVSAFSLIFYIISTYFAFQAYKEFKRISFEIFLLNN